MSSTVDKGVLHFALYNRGHAGMCNILLSVQNALIIARLTGRGRIVFYSEVHLFNSAKRLGILDLFDIHYEHSAKPLSEFPENISLLPDFSDCCIYLRDRPHPSFINGRQAFDLEGLCAMEHIGARGITLGYYSYIFHLKPVLRDEVVEFVKTAIVPKDEYLRAAMALRGRFSAYQSMHLRRGDYLSVPGTRNGAVTWDEMLPNLCARLDRQVPVLVHTDEPDPAYFQPLVDAGYSLHFFENELPADFDDVQKGLVSLLVAAHAERFIGTMISTFTGVIHQYRRQHGDYSAFKYIYSQVASVELKSAEIACRHFGVHSWNRISLSDSYRKTLFFLTEHPECYPNKDLAIDYALKVYPDFLTEQEIAYLSGVFESGKIDHDARQNRHRAVLHLDREKLLEATVQRVLKVAATRDHVIENEVQMFLQYEGGETFLHSDSLAGDIGTKRVLSVLFYLNDDYDGGHLDFPYLKTRVSPARGTMMCFPIVNKYGEQVPDFSHSASVVTKGRKLMCYMALKVTGTPRPS